MTEKNKKYAYPWAELYDMESRLAPVSKETGRIGRPRQLYIRRRTSLMLSDEEASLLAIATLKLQEALRPGSVTKSQVYGLAVRLLSDRLRLLKERVGSWEDVVQALMLEEEGEVG